MSPRSSRWAGSDRPFGAMASPWTGVRGCRRARPRVPRRPEHRPGGSRRTRAASDQYAFGHRSAVYNSSVPKNGGSTILGGADRHDRHSRSDTYRSCTRDRGSHGIGRDGLPLVPQRDAAPRRHPALWRRPPRHLGLSTARGHPAQRAAVDQHDARAAAQGARAAGHRPEHPRRAQVRQIIDLEVPLLLQDRPMAA